jgi:hypothetical protein
MLETAGNTRNNSLQVSSSLQEERQEKYGVKWTVSQYSTHMSERNEYVVITTFSKT